jgi:hypothetical protein
MSTWKTPPQCVSLVIAVALGGWCGLTLASSRNIGRPVTAPLQTQDKSQNQAQQIPSSQAQNQEVVPLGDEPQDDFDQE